MSTLVNNFGQYGISTESGLGCGAYTAASPYWTSLVPWVRNLTANPGFETGSTPPWQMQGAMNGNTVANGTAKSGTFFMRFRTTSGPPAQPGSMYQDMTAEVPSTGDSYIFNIWARAPSASACLDVRTALWAIGGSQPSASNTFLNLCGTAWRLLTTSLDVGDAGHTALRAEVYVNLNGNDWNEYLHVDAAEVIHVKDKNASFERWKGTVPDWDRIHPSGGILQWAQYGNGASGGYYLQANKTNGNTGSIYQDIPIITTPGESYTFSLLLKSPGGTRYAHIAIWGLGGTNESATTYTGSIPTAWTTYSVTLNVANFGHNKLRIEIYLDAGCCELNYDMDGTRFVKNN